MFMMYSLRCATYVHVHNFVLPLYLTDMVILCVTFKIKFSSFIFLLWSPVSGLVEVTSLLRLITAFLYVLFKMLEFCF